MPIELYGVGVGAGENVSIGGNTDGTAALISSGTLYVMGGNNVTISQDGNSLTIQGETNSGATTFLAGASNIGNTGGQTGAINQRLAIVGSDNITLSQTTNAGNSGTLAIYGNAPFKGGVSTVGNTAGDTKTVSNQIVFVGGTNITLSQDTAAGGATVNVIGAAAQTGLSGVSASDTVYTSGTFKITGSNMVTVKSGAGQAVVIDATQSLQTNSRFNLTLGSNSTSSGGGYALVSSGVLTLAGGSNITLEQDVNLVKIHGASGGAGGGVAASMSGNNTLGTKTVISSGTMYFAGGNNITLSQEGNSLTMIGAAAGTGAGIMGIANSDFTLTDGTVMFQDGSGVTFGMVGHTITASVSDNIHVSIAGGNTAGTMTEISSGTLSLAGGNNITLSQLGNAVTISAMNSGVAVLVGTDGNTDGTITTITSGTAQFFGGNNITLSQDGHSITISGADGGGAGMGSDGNTAGTSGIAGSQLWFVGTNGISLSQSLDASSNNATITIDGGALSGIAFEITGNTDGTSTLIDAGVVYLSGGSNITLFQDGSSVGIIGESGGGTGGVGIIGSDATYTSGNVVFSGENNITVASGTGQVILISGPSGGGAGMGDGTNTAGTSGSVGAELYFYDGANITLSQNVSSNSASLTIIGASGAPGAGFTAGMGSDGNTAGTGGQVPASSSSSARTASRSPRASTPPPRLSPSTSSSRSFLSASRPAGTPPGTPGP